MELIQIRVDSETKVAAIALFDALGMDLSTAIRSFLKKAIADENFERAAQLRDEIKEMEG